MIKGIINRENVEEKNLYYFEIFTIDELGCHKNHLKKMRDNRTRPSKMSSAFSSMITKTNLNLVIDLITDLQGFKLPDYIIDGREASSPMAIKPLVGGT